VIAVTVLDRHIAVDVFDPDSGAMCVDDMIVVIIDLGAIFIVNIDAAGVRCGHTATDDQTQSQRRDEAGRRVDAVKAIWLRQPSPESDLPVLAVSAKLIEHRCALAIHEIPPNVWNAAHKSSRSEKRCLPLRIVSAVSSTANREL